MLFCDGRKGNKPGNPGVRENNIDSPLCLSDGLVKTIKVRQLGNVPLNARNVGVDDLYGLVEFLLAAARDEDIGTLFDEKLAVASPNPSVRSVITALPSRFLVIVLSRCC